MSQKRRYLPKTLKSLWAKSGNLCAFPGCSENLIIEGSEDVLGNICHIISESGPRANPNFPKEQFDDYCNLILLCRNCHGKIDSKTGEEKYTSELLKKWKVDHEEKVEVRL